MIIDAKEMEMDRAELLAELYVLSARKEELARDISRCQQKVTDAVSALLEEERGDLEGAAGTPGIEIVSFLHDYAEKNTDVSDLAAAAALIMLLRFADDNKDQLELEIPRQMTFQALSMRMPDMIGTEELEDWVHLILTACGAEPEKRRIPEKVAVYCTISSQDALLGNLFQMADAYETGSEAGRTAAIGVIYHLLDFVLQRGKSREADTETIRIILAAMQSLARKAGDAMVEEAALKAHFRGTASEDAARIRTAMKAVLDLQEQMKEAEEKFDRLLGLL